MGDGVRFDDETLWFVLLVKVLASKLLLHDRWHCWVRRRQWSTAKLWETSAFWSFFPSAVWSAVVWVSKLELWWAALLVGVLASRAVVGCFVGGSVVVKVGAIVGCLVGCLVGGGVGFLVGAVVGALVGGGVGALVGAVVGYLVGGGDSFNVGDAVGCYGGRSVGFAHSEPT